MIKGSRPNAIVNKNVCLSSSEDTYHKVVAERDIGSAHWVEVYQTHCAGTQGVDLLEPGGYGEVRTC